MAFEGKAVKVLLEDRFKEFFDERIPLFIKCKYIITEDQSCDKKAHDKLGNQWPKIANELTSPKFPKRTQKDICDRCRNLTYKHLNTNG